MHASQMTCGVIALIISLSGLASLAISKKCFAGRCVDRHPNFTQLSVNSIGMSTQFMLTPEAIGIIIARRTLQTKNPSRRRPCWSLECRRCTGRLSCWSCQNCLLSWRRLNRISGLGSGRSTSGCLLLHFGFCSSWGHLQTIYRQGCL